LQRYVKLLGGNGVTSGSSSESWETGSNKVGSVSNHVVITSLLSAGKSKAVPDGKPFSIVLVDPLTSDLNFNILDQMVSYFRNPGET
jgi:hypothetical protein